MTQRHPIHAFVRRGKRHELRVVAYAVIGERDETTQAEREAGRAVDEALEERIAIQQANGGA